MKAMKRLFSRKKRQEDASAAKRVSAPSKPILKSTTDGGGGDRNMPAAPGQNYPSSTALTARSDSHRASGASAAPQAPASAAASKPAAPPARKPPPPQDPSPQKHPNGSKLPTEKTSSSSSAESVRDQFRDNEQGSYKGVSESFKKGLTVTQRYGVGEASEEHTATDPNQLGKLGDAYDSIPLLEQTKLPRGGISMETKAVGRIQVSSIFCSLELPPREVCSRTDNTTLQYLHLF